MPYDYSEFGQTYFGEPAGGLVVPLESGVTPEGTLDAQGIIRPSVERAIKPVPWDIYTIRPNIFRNGQLLTQARNRRFVWDLNEAHTMSFEIDGKHPEALLIDELATDLIVYRDGLRLFRGRAGASGDRIDATEHTSAFTAVSYKGLLYRREMATAIDTLATPLDQAELAWQAITQTQTRDGGNLSIRRDYDDASGTGILRGDKWEAGKMVGAFIDEIAQREYGFEWDITPELMFNLYYPNRGNTTSYVMEYGGNISEVDRTLDTSNFANFVRSVGTDDAGTDIQATSELANIEVEPTGRWDYNDGGADTKTAAQLGARAAGKLAEMSGITPSYILTMKKGTWDPTKCWLGDTIRLVIFEGRLSVNTLYRVQRIEATVGDDNDESVKITVGAPIMSLNNRLYFYSRRLDELERR